MRYSHLILIGVAIPLLLTATVFAAPGRGGFFGMQTNDATNAFQAERAAEAAPSDIHHITLVAEQIPSNGLLGYKMEKHTVMTAGTSKMQDLTNRYSNQASIPGPTIVLREGDEVFLTVRNSIATAALPADPALQKVSVHVHGVHYDINSDGTSIHINHINDQAAVPGGTFNYHWIAGPGTAGTWPYHDHTFGGLNGAEHKGLFGTVIVNPASAKVDFIHQGAVKQADLKEVAKDFVLYVGDDAFWGTEITPSNGKQTPLWTNPTLVAKDDTLVRFHLIALGTDHVHTFVLNNYQWIDPGTTNFITSKDIGPLENHVFVIKAKTGTTTYEDLQTSNDLMGMEGIFKVTKTGGSSTASPVPGPF